MCKVSIILPSLNVIRYIRQCLDSVVNQTLREIELICVDAGSTDGTLEVLREYESRDARVQVIVSDRKSYGYQMNLGLRAAKGEYVGIVETDDYVPLNMFEDLYAIAVEQRVQIVKADFYRFKEKDGMIERAYNRLDGTDTYYNRVICPGQEQGVFRMIMNTWSGIYERAFLLEHGIVHNETPGASFQDNGFWFKTFCCAERAYFVPRPYYMNRRDNADSSVFSDSKVYCISDEYAHIYDWLKEDEARFKRFISVFTLKEYHSMIFTYGRIKDEYKQEFVRHFGERMRSRLGAQECDRKLFTPMEWHMLNQIANEPDTFAAVRGAGFVSKAGLTVGSAVPALKKAICKVDYLVNQAALMFSWIAFFGPVKLMRRRQWKCKMDTVKKEKNV